MAVGALAVELLPQEVVGQLERVLPLSLQTLQIELALQIQLLRPEMGFTHHRQEQWQQG